MNNHRQHPWFGLDDLGDEEISSLGLTDPKPLYNEKSQRDQDRALQNPEESIDKDPNKPWVQGEERPSKESDSRVNRKSTQTNRDLEIDEWAETEKTEPHQPR